MKFADNALSFYLLLTLLALGSARKNFIRREEEIFYELASINATLANDTFASNGVGVQGQGSKSKSGSWPRKSSKSHSIKSSKSSKSVSWSGTSSSESGKSSSGSSSSGSQSGSGDGMPKIERIPTPHEFHVFEQVKFVEEPDWTGGCHLGPHDCFICKNPNPIGGQALLIEVKSQYKRADWNTPDTQSVRQHCIMPQQEIWTCGNMIIEPDTSFLSNGDRPSVSGDQSTCPDDPRH